MHGPDPTLFSLFTQPLDDLGLAYMVTGSVASIIYGEPRLTHDIDLVLVLKTADIDPLLDVFPIDRFYCPPRDALVIEATRDERGHFNLIHHGTGFKADVYLKGRSSLQAWAFERRNQLEIAAGTHLWVAPPEYVIVRKLEYYREGGSDKHVRDIRGILSVSGDDLDNDALQEWIGRLGLKELWEQVQPEAADSG